jgi:hypothetical protein
MTSLGGPPLSDDRPPTTPVRVSRSRWPAVAAAAVLLCVAVVVGLYVAGIGSETAVGSPSSGSSASLGASSPVASPIASSLVDAGATESFIREPYSPAEFWGYVAGGGDGEEVYDSLAAMTTKADAVVVGTVIAIRTDPARYQSLDLQGALYATLTLKIETVLAGKVNVAAPGQLNLAVFMADPRQYARFAAGLPSERAIYFLRNELVETMSARQTPLPDAAIYYSVVSDQGLIRDVGGAAMPVANFPYLVALQGRPFDAVVAEVAAAAQ